MNSNRPSEPPEEPFNRSEPATLSPASPKPIHFPAPTTIPLLELQMDVDHNQVEKHMADPAMHNTEVRPDFWRDPNEQQQEQEQQQKQQQQQQQQNGEEQQAQAQSTITSTDDQVTAPAQERATGQITNEEGAATSTDSNMHDINMNVNLHDTSSSTSTFQPQQVSNQASYQDNNTTTSHFEARAPLEPDAASEQLPFPSNTYVSNAAAAEPLSGNGVVPDTFATAVDQVRTEQPPSGAPAGNGGVDVDSLLATLQGPPATDSNATGAATAPNNGVGQYTPSQAQEQPPPPGVEGASAASSSLNAPPNGLPARPPPQEQPLINPNYVHSQHIRDYHPHAVHSAYQPQQQQQSQQQGGGDRANSQGNAANAASQDSAPSIYSSDSTPFGQSAVGGNFAPSGNGVPAATEISYSTNASAGSPTTSQQQQQPHQPQQIYQQSTSSDTGFGQQLPQQQHQQQQTISTSATSDSTNLAVALQQQTQTPYTSAQSYSASLSASNTPIESRREWKLAAGQIPSPEDRPWNAEVQKKYDAFIEAERGYVSEGRWEQFPTGSRLFVGNLSSEKVTKRDIFHVFHPYGELAQISIKQAYGFVQFLRAEDCARALDGEQGVKIREKRVHLEVSKPQKNKVPSGQQQQRHPRRSRSPDIGRGKPPPSVDRYTSERGGRSHGGYSRQGSGGFRSPSPPRYGGRGYSDRGYRDRSPDYGRGGRYRSPSPRRSEDDDLPLPRRQPRDVPDVQIIVLDALNRDFISWVERAFSSRGIRVDVLLLSPRLDEQAVIRRQIVEGVTAVSRLTRTNQDTGKIGLRIFDRRGGQNNVKFEDYDHLDPQICVELVLRAKNSYALAPPSTPSYSSYAGNAPQYGLPPPPQPPSSLPPQFAGFPGQQPLPPPSVQAYGHPSQPPPGYPPHPSYVPAPPPPPQSQQPPLAMPPSNLQSLISSLDPSGLQNLLSAMNNPSGSTNPQQQHHQQQQQAALAALQQNPAIVGMLQQQQQQQPTPQPQAQVQGGSGSAGPRPGSGGGNVNMQDILARLGTYGR
ncbi:hypothetical protein KC340_g15659 [Hortaea werneckii]|nr:hypothetical protein KC342_g10962 [Hortaea werneckii]KAI7090746.1 hypothetical protein KC339_g12605 [Hortaea werneckii]KAI7208848.1 hypothetical protein KC365_g15910 [Hortaea werneckii]KAI7295756.1 hypothetical protein KC340_g15659 [Hortaea werneckii]KAI7388909.1 hypothetical protein KC328_g8715 [Hortaea werneckii]